MSRCDSAAARPARRRGLRATAGAAARGTFGAVLALVTATGAAAPASCAKPLYLTFDTGHMGVAPLVADVLARHHVKVTFFLANERTQTDGSSLDDHWAPWWRARVADGDVFGSHTYDHVYWQKDLPDGRFLMRPSAGPNAGKREIFTAQQYCDALRKSAARFREMTGHDMLPLFRAPGGKTSPALLKAAEACGYRHVGWSPAGFLGDELPSDKYSNSRLLSRALASIRPGDILMAHLGIWSRQDPWAPAVLEPLITGLQARGFCFETLDRHPAYRGWVAAHRPQAGTESPPVR
ncbi:polysaccharide deacetylase family protein [Bordetella genomosp. 9]|uniref:Peptidase A8 n=1 Tax=Bordetella genomosp. 9 TaxID=1416803 RepID=A0A1W6YWR3_9BORD|nr:polysaccharide deacetylase family protein [Bordetella genomosp. 9]ARP85552.1 peptidase A8 [Bordetella genomosp. 9]